MSNEIRIYVTKSVTSAIEISYGIWIDALLSPDEIMTRINTIANKGSNVSGDKYEISAYEGFRTYNVDAHESIDRVHEIACLIHDYPDYGSELLNYYYHSAKTIEDAKVAVKYCYAGCFTSIKDYLESVTDDGPITIPPYIEERLSYKSIAHDIYGDKLVILRVDSDKYHVFDLSKH